MAMRNGLSKEDFNLLVEEMAKRHNLMLRPDGPMSALTSLHRRRFAHGIILRVFTIE